MNESAYVFRADSRKDGLRGAHPENRDSDDVSAGELIEEMTRDMLEAADRLEFERAAYLRDRIAEIKKAAEEPG